MNALYRLHNLSQQFGGREVLHIDELTIEAGKIYGLLGQNGAGKSTLMKLLAFLEAPASGCIGFQGQHAPFSQAARLRSKVVWVPQTPIMFSGSVLYNVAYPLRIKGVSSQVRERRACELLEVVGLAHMASAPAPRLSGGEAQRVSIARALAAGAEVILFDEPTANVDTASRDALMETIRTLWGERGLSIVITTHDAAFAAALCHDHIVLDAGRVVPQRVLGGGLVAWPAVLRCAGETFAVALPAEAGASFPLRVVGITDLLEGVSLRLTTEKGRSLDVLVAAGSGASLARTLTLGAVLQAAAE